MCVDVKCKDTSKWVSMNECKVSSLLTLQLDPQLIEVSVSKYNFTEIITKDKTHARIEIGTVMSKDTICGQMLRFHKTFLSHISCIAGVEKANTHHQASRIIASVN